MKTILLLRHAKSDWGEPGLADFERPLNKRGLKDAPRMGEALALFDVIPAKIISSPARRARQTAELVAGACGYNQKLIQEETSFYGGDNSDLLTALQCLPDDVERVMLVGHNPTMEETAAMLVAANEKEGIVRLPTAGLVCLEVDITEWAALQPGQAVLSWFLIPRLVQVFRPERR